MANGTSISRSRIAPIPASCPRSSLLSKGFGTPPTVNADKDQIKEFGLADPGTKIILTQEKEKPIEIDLGKDTAVDGKVYALVAGSNVVQVISNDLKNQIAKKPDDFRDRRLAALTTQQVSKVDTKSAAGEMELAKKNNHWSIDKPLEARGDDSKINDLISQAATAHIDQFIADQNLATYGLAEPSGTITFTVEGSDKPVTLAVGVSPKEEKDKEKVYVKLSTRDSVTLVPKSTVEALLNAKPNEIRDKNLLRVESDIVDRINVEPAGKPKIILARKGESWVRKDGDKEVTINAAAAKRILTDLQAAQVVNFVSEGAADLPKYGLDQPVLKVTFSSFASENTAETNAGEKPIVTVLFGKTEGPDVYVKLDNEPFIVTTAKSILDGIATDPIQFQDLTIYKFKPDEITSLEVTKNGQPALALERDKDNKDKPWKLTKGEGMVNQSNVASLVSSLADLRANRWAGAPSPEQGLDKPTVLVTFTATQGDKTIPGKLTVGATGPEDHWYAVADGVNGIFLMNRVDESALLLSLTDKDIPPKPETPPTPGTPAAPGAAETKPAPATPEPAPAPAAPETKPAPAPSSPDAKPAPSAPAPEPGAPPSTPTAPAAPPAPPAPAPAAPAPAAPAATEPVSPPAAPAPAPASPAPDAPKPAPAPQ